MSGSGTGALHEEQESAVRDARLGDLESLVELLAQLHPLYDAKMDEQLLSQILRDPRRSLLVAERSAQVVGTVDMLIVPNLSHAGRPWAIAENLVVDAQLRGGGIGKLLMTEVLARADEAGCYMIQFLSLKHRIGAHAFYRQLGYESVCEGFRLYRAGFAATTAHD